VEVAYIIHSVENQTNQNRNTFMARYEVFVFVLLSSVCFLSQLKGQDNRAKTPKSPVRNGNLDSGERKADASESKSQIQPLFSMPVGGNFPRVRFSPCSRYIAYWTGNVASFSFRQSNLRIRDLLTGKECFSFEGTFTNFHFRHDGESIALCEGKSVSVWEVKNGNQLAEFKGSDLAWFLREGEVLATRSIDDNSEKPEPVRLQLWDTRNWTEIPSKLANFASYRMPVITRDARFAAALVRSGKEQATSLKIWELGTGKELTSPSITNPLEIALANNTHAIRVQGSDGWFDWNFETENLFECETPTIDLFDIPPLDYSYSLNRPHARIGRVKLVDGNWQITSDGRIIKTFPNHSSWCPTQINHNELISDNLMLLTRAESGGEINVWNLEQPNQPRTITFEKSVTNLTLAGDGRTLAILSKSNSNEIQTIQDPTRVTLVDLQQETQPKILTEGKVVNICFAHESQILAVVFPEKVELWNTAELRMISVHRNAEHAQYPENRMAEVSSNALQIVIASNNFIELRNIADDRIQWKTEVGWVDKLKMSEDGRYIAVSTDSNTVRQKICVLSASDGRLLACGATDHRANLFQFWRDRQVLTLVRQEDRVTQIDLSSKSDIERFEAGKSIDYFAPDRYADNFAASALTGQYAVAGTVEGYSEPTGEVRIRDLVSGELQLKLSATTGRIACASFFPNGRKLVAGGSSRTKHSIEVIDLTHGTTACTINGELMFSVSSDGKLLLTRDPIDGGKLSLWRSEDGRLHSIITHADATHAFFSPNGETIATTSGLLTGSGMARVWSVPQLLHATSAKAN
jgi:WD40 repeat protein